MLWLIIHIFRIYIQAIQQTIDPTTNIFFYYIGVNLFWLLWSVWFHFLNLLLNTFFLRISFYSTNSVSSALFTPHSSARRRNQHSHIIKSASTNGL